MEAFSLSSPVGVRTSNSPTYLWVLSDIADTRCHCFILTTQGEVERVIVTTTFGCKTGSRLQRMESGMRVQMDMFKGILSCTKWEQFWDTHIFVYIHSITPYSISHYAALWVHNDYLSDYVDRVTQSPMQWQLNSDCIAHIQHWVSTTLGPPM